MGKKLWPSSNVSSIPNSNLQDRTEDQLDLSRQLLLTNNYLLPILNILPNHFLYLWTIKNIWRLKKKKKNINNNTVQQQDQLQQQK